MSSNETRIALRCPRSGLLHKITKIVSYKDGGFGFLMPYHSSRSGFLAKLPVDYNRVGEIEIAHSDIIAFTADSRVKFSYHADGFAQFSGEVQGTLISGRDPLTGEAKGLGLITQPLNQPIITGPTCAISFWGLEAFDSTKGETDCSVVFSDEDCYYRACTPSTATGWVIEFFVFPARYWTAVRKKHNRYVLSLSFFGFEASMGVIELTVIELPNQPVFIASFASRCSLSFPSTSGWTFAGPGNCDTNGHGHCLQAFYPRDGMITTNARSLNREVKEITTST